MTESRRRQRKWRPRRDWGRVLALVLCAVFGFIGAVPLCLGFLVRTEPVRKWAATQTEALLAQKLAVTATYDVKVQAWPMLVALENVRVNASDGGAPFLFAERIAVRPRPFSLLAGWLDAGDVEIVGPRVRAVVEKGELKNLAYKLPETGETGGGPPLASLSITDARIDATVDGTRIAAREVDLDLSSEGEGAFEIALRAGETAVTRVRAFPGRPDEDAVDDDVLCRLEARVRVQGRSLLVRRLSLEGSADFDPDPGTRPSCSLRPTDWRAVEVRLGALHVELPHPGSRDENVYVTGRVHAKVPAALVHRFKDVADATGSITADVTYDGVVPPPSVAPLPVVAGHVAADYAGIDGKVFGKRIDLQVSVGGTTVRATDLVAEWADGKVTIPEITVEPFVEGVPIATSPIAIEGVELTGLLRDLGAHPRSHVAWTLDKGRIEHMSGTLDPPYLEGPLAVQTHGFEIFDRPAIDPGRAHMMGVREGTVRCTFVIDERKQPRSKLRGVVFANASIVTQRSHLDATVTLGTDAPNIIDIDVREGSKVELEELSPLGDIPVRGALSLRASGRGRFEHPKLTGALAIADFDFAGLPVGDVEAPRFAFEPLVLDMESVRLRHGPSRVRSQKVRLAFADGATVVADADVDTREGPGLRFKDLFEVFHFDKDPRFSDIEATARGKARVRYVLGGREDRCGGGLLDLTTSMDLEDATVLGERFERGTLDAGLVWDDANAGSAGMRLDLRSATLQKGDGSILVSATVRHGGFLRGNAVGSGIPLSRLDAFGAYGKLFEGTGSVVAQIGGTLSAMELGADVSLSRLRIGPAALGPSRFHVGMIASPPPPPPPAREEGCRGIKEAGFNQARYDLDLTGGDVVIDGALFDGQVSLDGLRVTRQRHKVVRGRVVAKALDLGPLANLVPGVAWSGVAPTGALSATLDLKSLPLATPKDAQLSLTLDALEVARDGSTAKLGGKPAAITLHNDELTVPPLKIGLRSAAGFQATVVAQGAVHKATTAPYLSLGVGFEPDVDLGKIEADIPSVEHAAGTLKASLAVTGPLAALSYSGAAQLQKGELTLKGVPLGLRDIDVVLAITDGEVRLTRAFARVGGGTVQATGRAPLRGSELGAFSANVTARGVKVPAAEGVSFTSDAELEVTRRPGALADVKGAVELTQFSYTRPITLNLLNFGLSRIGLAPRARVETYDPAGDLFRFSVNVVSAKSRPLRIRNNLVDLDLEVMDPGIVLSGTNQRFGARGLLRILPDSKIQLRSNEFLVREGFVRFDDATKIVPNVDLRAQTEYRRYVASGGPEPPAGASTTAAPEGASGASAAASTSAAGLWRIVFQARGEADKLKVTLSSDPPLSQEDIVLLLAVGLTRAEIDRAAATAALGQGLGLEALSTLTGADTAVKTIVPLIDEFRFGTGYSSRTASPEPTVTIGKRITSNIHATVTTGVSESSEVRSNVEWRLNRNLSVQGSYDNLNDVSSSPVGNVGVDLRWRLEFE